MSNLYERLILKPSKPKFEKTIKPISINKSPIDLYKKINKSNSKAKKIEIDTSFYKINMYDLNECRLPIQQFINEKKSADVSRMKTPEKNEKQEKQEKLDKSEKLEKKNVKITLKTSK